MTRFVNELAVIVREENDRSFIFNKYMHTANSPAKGKSPRRSRSMKTVTERQRIGDESARFHR